MVFNPTPAQQEVLDAEDDLLVVGQPGSGKTTVALEKARRLISAGSLAEHHRVLFLSFSNAAVNRIQVASRTTLDPRDRRHLEITTFHAFCLRILAAHRRLLGLRKPFALLPSEEEKILRSKCESSAQEKRELGRLEREEGQVIYDRFAPLVVELLQRIPALRSAYAGTYPLVFADEYQDTDDAQDELVRQLAEPGQLVCLGDPDQRIYGFRPGVRSDRLDRAERDLNLRRIVLTGNHRSGGFDIVDVARAVLNGQDRIPDPRSVRVRHYGNYTNLPVALKRAILEVERSVRRAAGEPNRRVSTAVMCYTNAFVGRLSEMLRTPDGQFERPFGHNVLLPPDQLAIAWDTVLAIMEPGLSVRGRTQTVLRRAADLQRLKGRQTNLERAERLERWAAELMEGTLDGRAQGVHALREGIGELVLSWTGDPEQDARSVTAMLRGIPGGHLDDIVRILEQCPLPGSNLYLGDRLTRAYLDTGAYTTARRIGREAVLQERLGTTTETTTGRVLLTMHKCKGKEFDGVVLVDGLRYHDFVVYRDSRPQNFPKTRRLLHVAISRARYSAVILTPVHQPSPLLPDFVS